MNELILSTDDINTMKGSNQTKYQFELKQFTSIPPLPKEYKRNVGIIMVVAFGTDS